MINYKTLGLSASLTGLDVELWDVVNEPKRFDKVEVIWLTTGDHTLMLEIVVGSVEELSN